MITALNVRDSPGVKVNPSNHKKIWLKNGDCVIILGQEIILVDQHFNQRWAYVEIIQEGGESIKGWVRLNQGITDYVVIVPPYMTPTPTASQP